MTSALDHHDPVICRQVAAEAFADLERNNRVVFAPHQQRRRLNLRQFGAEVEGEKLIRGVQECKRPGAVGVGKKHSQKVDLHLKQLVQEPLEMVDIALLDQKS